MAVANSNRKTMKFKTGLAWGAIALVAVLLLANLLHDVLFRGRPLQGSSAGTAAASEKEKEKAAVLPTSVTLPEGKWKTAGITTEPARVTKLTAEVGVPGRIEANIDRQVEVRPRANGVVREVRAVLGQ